MYGQNGTAFTVRLSKKGVKRGDWRGIESEEDILPEQCF